MNQNNISLTAPEEMMSYKVLKKAGIDPRLLLAGRYEADSLPKDFSPQRIVPDFAFNVLNPLGLLYRPVLDEAYLSAGGTKPQWPGGKPFAVCLSHDVDNVTLYSQKQALRGRIDAFKSGNATQKLRNVLGFGIDSIRTSSKMGSKDPLHCYERWLEEETAVNAKSTFFFWPGLSSVGRRHISDCTYELTDRVVFDGQKCTTAEMIREIHRRGWEIGLHPSWYSFDNVDEMKRQKAALEKALGNEVVSVRQHQLHFDIRITPRVQAEAGLRYGSTIGFNDNLGFRFGTSYPWQINDLQTGEKLPLTEIPLVIQDGAMLSKVKGLRLDEDTSFKYIQKIAHAVESVGGVLTLLWHPNVIMDPAWWNLYLRAITYLKERNAWFGTTREVGEKARIENS